MCRSVAPFLAIACLVLSSVSEAQSSDATAPVVASAERARTGLRPGDLIRLKIWREPDLSGDFEINEAGVAVLPKLGPVNILAMPTDSVRAKLFDQYRAFLSHSSIEIALLRRVQILGAVRNPGLYPLDPTMTIGDAVAVAGGAAPNGDQKKVQLIRRGERLPQTLSYHTRVADSPVQSGDQLFVPERSWFVRNAGLLTTGIAAGVSLIVAFSRR